MKESVVTWWGVFQAEETWLKDLDGGWIWSREASWSRVSNRGEKELRSEVIRSQILQGTVSHHRGLDGKSLWGYDQRNNMKR